MTSSKPVIKKHDIPIIEIPEAPKPLQAPKEDEYITPGIPVRQPEKEPVKHA